MSFDVSEIKDVRFFDANGKELITLHNACVSAGLSFNSGRELPIYNFEITSCGPVSIEKEKQEPTKSKKEKEFKVMYGDSSL